MGHPPHPPVHWHAFLLEEAKDYTTLKTEILSHCGLSSAQVTTDFLHWAYRPEKEPQAQMDMLEAL